MRVCAPILSLLAVLLLTACGGQVEPTPTRTPRPTATFTPLPTLAVAMPLVETELLAADDPGQGGAALPTPGQDVSPLATPTFTPEPTATPTPGLEVEPPVSVLAANLACGEDCNAGNPAGVGLVIFNLRTAQLNTWVANLDPLEGEEYEGWLVHNQSGRVESAGRFNVDAEGEASEFIVLPDLVAEPWDRFVLTIEPEPDDSEEPAAPHSVGGSLRSTVMGEALYSRFNMPCQECHGPAAEGVAGQLALTGLSVGFEEFLATVRQHENTDLSQVVVADRDLRHMYAWLMATPDEADKD